MRKIFTFLLSVLIVSTLSAQKPEATLPKLDVAPEVGGEMDAIWDEIEQNDILLPFKTETPSFGYAGDTWWKGAWVKGEGLYILVNVTDDDYYPYYAAVDEADAKTAYQYDQVELYFDCNYVKEDGVGARPGGQDGHYQIAATVPKGGDDGTLKTDFNNNNNGGITFAYNADDAPNWFEEVYIPFSWLKDADGVMADITSSIGFDVTVIDNDRPGGDSDRQRAVWANDGTGYGMDESWNNMDQAGLIYLESATVAYITEINLTGGDITSDNQEFQIGIELVSDVPGEEPTDKTLKWVIDPSSTAMARISDDGVVTPITNGVFTVYAMSADEFVESDPVDINIDGQIVRMEELSIVKDGLFDKVDDDLKPTGGWSIGTGGTIVDGVAWCTPPSDGAAHNTWDWQLAQGIVPITMEEINDPFLFQFKLWADVADTINIDFEDSNNSYSRYGVSSDPESNGSSDWTFVCNTEPTTYNFHVTFSNMAENANQRLQIMLGRATANVYVDSVFLIKEEYVDLITGVNDNRLEAQEVKVYPNPANDVINVTLEKGNTNVAIYNSVGIKMEEIRVEGTQHVFNVSDYSPGLYFVKANNTVVKFVK